MTATGFAWRVLTGVVGFELVALVVVAKFLRLAGSARRSQRAAKRCPAKRCPAKRRRGRGWGYELD